MCNFAPGFAAPCGRNAGSNAAARILQNYTRMSGYISDEERPVTTQRLVAMKNEGKKIAMLTSYDYTTARIVDEAGVDVILVGDSASNVMAGNDTTLPITVEQMIYHAQSVARAVKHALVVCDMPFGSYQVSKEEALRNAIHMMKESGCDALKLEGGKEIADTVNKICGNKSNSYGDKEMLELFDMLWKEGIMPEVFYEKERWENVIPLNKAADSYIKRMSVKRELTQKEIEKIKAYFTDISESGIVTEITDAVLCTVYWKENKEEI